MRDAQSSALREAAQQYCACVPPTSARSGGRSRLAALPAFLSSASLVSGAGLQPAAGRSSWLASTRARYLTAQATTGPRSSDIVRFAPSSYHRPDCNCAHPVARTAARSPAPPLVRAGVRSADGVAPQVWLLPLAPVAQVPGWRAVFAEWSIRLIPASAPPEGESMTKSGAPTASPQRPTDARSAPPMGSPSMAWSSSGLSALGPCHARRNASSQPHCGIRQAGG